ncbi:MAG: fasciclin domain-containing protein [Paludibacter sp.]|nr:fasciclin domain-containing protein [Paludibacter sp.]
MKRILNTILLIGILSGVFVSCDSDDVGGNLYTFTGEMVGQYLQNDTVQFSEFVRLLDTTNVMGLLNSYGSYTCFAPTNDAMHAFYKEKGKNSLSDFSLDSLQVIAYDHIIDGAVVLYSNFIDGRIPEITMSDRNITIHFTDSVTWVNYDEAKGNENAYIINKDVVKHNGVLHVISKVLNPSREGIVEAIAKETDFSIFYQALIETGMADSLLKIEDETYDKTEYAYLITKTLDDGSWYYEDIPDARRYRYTVLMESNETMNANNIYNIEDLKTYAAGIYDEVYPEDANVREITDRHNSLNRFIAYHLIDKQLSKFTFIDAYDTDHMIRTPGRDMYEYVETMCPNTLIEVKKERATGTTNIFNYLPETGDALYLSDTFYDKTTTNGIYHEIDGMLVYSKQVDNMLSSKRLRFDAASFFPELTNNNMRGSRYKQNTTSSLYDTPDLKYQIPRNYIARITSSEQTVVQYLTPYYKYQDYEGDEIFLTASTGKLYDFSIITPPIPAGTYEIRFGYLTNGKRGVAQLYFDNIPCGVPLNLNKSAVDNGWEEPGSDSSDPYGYDNDKYMSNLGYMKAPACFKVIKADWTSGENARYCNAAIRKILGTFTFSEAGHHVFAIKGLSGGEFMFDYMEFVPTSALESEDIY